MDSRRHFLEKVATGLAGTLASAQGRASAGDRVRIGMIGVGDRGLELLHQAAACGGAEIVALSDVYTRRLEKANGFWPQARQYADYHDLLEDKNVEAVFIATPTHLHAQEFCDALAAGKHVFVEKTLGLKLAQLKQMRAAYQKDNGAHVVEVGHQACSSGHAVDAAHYLNAAGHLGQLSMLNMQHHRNLPAGKLQWARNAMLTSDLNDRNVNWQAFAGDGSEFDAQRFLHWRYFFDYSGGAVTEFMSQQLAFWYKLLDFKIPYSVSMTGAVLHSADGRETPDTMTVSLVQNERVLVNWACGFANNQPGVTEELLGSCGTISRGAQVRYAPQKITRPGGVEYLGRTTQAPHAHVEHFLQAVRTGSAPACGFETGYRVAVACAMAVESYLQQRTVYWNTEAEEIV